MQLRSFNYFLYGDVINRVIKNLPGFEQQMVVKGNKVQLYRIITREANSLIKQIHNLGENKWRMPLMLPLELSKKWVESDLS